MMIDGTAYEPIKCTSLMSTGSGITTTTTTLNPIKSDISNTTTPTCLRVINLHSSLFLLQPMIIVYIRLCRKATHSIICSICHVGINKRLYYAL